MRLILVDEGSNSTTVFLDILGMIFNLVQVSVLFQSIQ